jgi:hypothetical protein
MQPANKLGVADLGDLPRCDYHVVISWLEFQISRRVAQPSLDPVPSDRVTRAPRYYETEPGRSVRSVSLDQDETAGAVPRAFVKNTVEVLRGADRGKIRRRDACDPFAVST